VNNNQLIERGKSSKTLINTVFHMRNYRFGMRQRI